MTETSGKVRYNRTEILTWWWQLESLYFIRKILVRISIWTYLESCIVFCHSCCHRTTERRTPKKSLPDPTLQLSGIPFILKRYYTASNSGLTELKCMVLTCNNFQELPLLLTLTLA